MKRLVASLQWVSLSDTVLHTWFQLLCTMYDP